MEEKIIISCVENHSDFLHPETHSIGASLLGENGYYASFPVHKADELGNFNIAARKVFEEYCSGKDLTPKKNQNLYSGKIVLINTKQEVTKYSRGIVIYNVIDGIIPELCLLTSGKDLRIEKNMTCSDLYKRITDMYFHCRSWFDKVMYVGGLGLQ